MKQIIECIPNFSEGRRPEVVDAIVEAISSVDGIILLDRSSDADHNRSVITFTGDLSAAGEAAFQGIAKAAELIDMEAQTGEHPRMGATDVVPFVPISGASMQDCVELAKALGKRVGEELHIPVYLYEMAASKVSRRNLAKVRKGEYEGIKAEIGKRAARKPDFGPEKLGSAGAVAIGARQPLVAYNVYLNSDDVGIAEEIAKAIRHSSGGLRYVKGAGFLVDGKAQVSMNLTNFKKTPIARVAESIKREAARFGVSVEKSELVGLIPQEALDEAATWYLQLNDFKSDQILERKIESVQQVGERQDIGEFLSAISSAEPTPGGGSVAAHAGALAAALLAMVGRVSMGKKKYQAVEEEMRAMVEGAEALSKSFSQAVERDAEAFDGVLQAFRLPKSTDAEKNAREKTIEEATIRASEVPLEVAEMALECLKLAVLAVEKGNINAISDAGTAAALAEATMRGASLNVRINLSSLDKSKTSSGLLNQLRKIEKEAKERVGDINQIIEERGAFSS